MTEEKNLRPYSHYFITSTAVPVILLVGSCTLVYFLTTYFKLSPTDKIFGYLITIVLLLLYRFKMLLRWTELPDGRYFYSGSIKPDKLSDRKKDFIPPTFYEKEFSYSRHKKITYLGLGILLLGVSYFLISKKDVILPVTLFLSGAYFIADSIKALTGGAAIKIAKQGIWIKGSGYYPWEEINKIYLSSESTQRPAINYLNIFLKAGFEAREYPTFKISVNDVQDFLNLEAIIEEYKTT